MNEVKVSLTAMEPSALLEGDAWPEGLWLRYDGTPWGAEIQLRGPESVVEQFIRDNWGEDEVTSIREFGGFSPVRP